VTHKESGITACGNTKSQHRNKQIALSVVVSRLKDKEQNKSDRQVSKLRNEQIPTLGRGTRVRTYNFIEGRVKDERVENKFRPEDIMKGKLDLIYNAKRRG